MIDSLRADRFIGENRTCKTPTIDSILDSGTYFSNMYSSSDVTGPCVGNFFTGMHSCKSKMTLHNFSKNVINLFDLLKKSNEYFLFGNMADITWFHNMTKDFDEKQTFFCGGLTQDGLNDKIGNNILRQLDKNYSKPWFYYVHIQDLHDNIIVPKEFDNEKYGDTKYDRQVSFIDSWLKKILEKINLENTVVIISADHASYVQAYNLGQMPTIQKFSSRIKQVFPSLEPFGLKLFIILRNLLISFQKKKLKRKLNSKEMRTLTEKGGVELFDDVLHVPLFFMGKGIPSNLKINQLVSGVDLFPTLLNLTNTSYQNSNIDGIDLHEFMKDVPLKDRCIYIESGGNFWNEDGKAQGIRTAKYKYLRSKNNPEKNVSLYDISSDPGETKNIADESPEIIKSLEAILQLIVTKKVNEKDRIKKTVFNNNKF